MRAIEPLATGENIGYTAFDPRFVSDSAFITLSKDIDRHHPRVPGSNNHLTTGTKNQLPLNITYVILHA
jgi:hypothetical protein